LGVLGERHISKKTKSLKIYLYLSKERVFREEMLFFYGLLSGIFELIAGVLGALMVFNISQIPFYALFFASKAMIFVVIVELIPESQQGNQTDLSTIVTMIGFATVMMLDVAFG